MIAIRTQPYRKLAELPFTLVFKGSKRGEDADHNREKAVSQIMYVSKSSFIFLKKRG